MLTEKLPLDARKKRNTKTLSTVFPPKLKSQYLITLKATSHKAVQ